MRFEWARRQRVQIVTSDKEDPVRTIVAFAGTLDGSRHQRGGQ
jgi:hypothetical protein